MQAIQTSYRGYLFRSRLEARWAVFFDALGLDWSYEVEGFELGNTRYLPDFLVTTFQYDDVYRDDGFAFRYMHAYYLEIKPKGIEHDYKFTEFQKALPEVLPEVCTEIDGLAYRIHTDVGSFLLSGDPMDMMQRQVSDYRDDVFSLIFSRLGCVETIGRNEITWTGLALVAARNARSARFEYGEVLAYNDKWKGDL